MKVFRLLLTTVLIAPFALGADTLVSKTTYSDAYGKTQNAVTIDPEKELPHYPAVAPNAAIATWQVQPGFALQLAAHEPQVRDPVAICFDERGRMFVCEMIDYSEQRDVSPHLGRISVLEDRDGDGFFETSQVFADDLPWPTGLIWANGGLFVGATPDIWRFEDRDGDSRAEIREKVYTGFGTGLKRLNVQGLLNSFQWGPDNRIHVLAGGGNRGVITSPLRPGQPGQELGGRDFWFDPLTYEFGLEHGGAQYGMSFDDFGRKFGCSNSDHLQHWVYRDETASRNTFFTMPPSRQSIAVDGGAAEVFRISPDEPWRIIRTRWRIAGTVPGAVEGGGRVSGYFTGATGTTIYRGDAFGPSFANNSFTGDAGGQLIHRKVIRPSADGVSLEGLRPDGAERVEFAASRDTWVRVVNFANAPDGCLYVCDMYREVIEHPWSIPDEIKQHLDLNQGNDRGRIYRITPTSGAPRIGKPINLAESSSAELVALLTHPNGWHRDTAQRLLCERRDVGAVSSLKELLIQGDAVAKLHVLSTLQGLGALGRDSIALALGDGDARVRERALELTPGGEGELEAKLLLLTTDSSPRVRFLLALVLARFLESGGSAGLEGGLLQLARQDHEHPWIGPAVLSAPPEVISRVLSGSLLKDEAWAVQAAPFVARLLEVSAAFRPDEGRDELIAFVAEHPRPMWLRALGDGLRRGKSSLQAADKALRLQPVFAEAARAAIDPLTAMDARIAAMETLSFAAAAEASGPISICLGESQPESVQTAALRSLDGRSGADVAALILRHWSGYQPAARALALDSLIARRDRLAMLFDALNQGVVSPTALNASQVQAILQHKDSEMASHGRMAIASVIPPSREEVVAKYRDAVALKGDGTKGQLHFAQRCVTCHRAAGQGAAVGPDLITVKTKGRDALLSAILEPGKEVAAQYILYFVTTKAGETLGGLITEDHATGMTLRMPGGLERTLLRTEIKGSSSAGLSLMPEGLEQGLSVQDMADLLTFIEELRES
jgi:putative membrane-bound dehydrogenase-like protein